MQPINRDPFPSQLSASRLPDVQTGAGIRVTGNTISWPSDGWHEVQYASSFNTVSEGGQSATLDPGLYNVINHSTGERFENIMIGQDAGGAPQRRSSLDALRDSPSTTDRLGGSDGPNWGPGGIRDYGTEPSTTTTVTPESDWSEVLGDATRDGGLAGYGALRSGASPLVIAEVALGAIALSVANNIDINTEPNPAATTPDSDYEPTGSATSSSHQSAPSGSGMGPDGATSGPDNTEEPETDNTTSSPSTSATSNRNSGGSGTTDSNSGSSGTTNSGGGFGDRTSEPGGMGGV